MFIRTHSQKKHICTRGTHYHSHTSFKDDQFALAPSVTESCHWGLKTTIVVMTVGKFMLLPLCHHNQLHYREVCAFYGREVGHQHPLPQCTTATGSILAPVAGSIITVKHLNSLYTSKTATLQKLHHLSTLLCTTTHSKNMLY